MRQSRKSQAVACCDDSSHRNEYRTAGLEIPCRRATEKEAVAPAVRTNKAELERGAADLALYHRGAFSEFFRVCLVHQRPRIASTGHRFGNAGGGKTDPIGDGVPNVANALNRKAWIRRTVVPVPGSLDRGNIDLSQ
jgi:hypothetical protein